MTLSSSPPTQNDAGAGPSLRGLGWGVLAVVVAAVVLFAAVLGSTSRGRGRDSAAPSPSGGVATTLPPVGPDGPPLRGGWGFDENQGSATADLAGTAPLKLRTGSRWDPVGRTGSALYFDGARGYAATDGPVLDTTASYTVSVWVRLDRVPAEGLATAVSQDGGRDSAFFLQFVPSSRTWSMTALNPGGVEVRALSTDPAQLSRWTHLTGVRDVTEGRLILYVDGVRQSSALFTQRQASSGSLAVGRGLFASRQTDFWPGSVDGLRAYGGALTPQEVRSVYESGR